MPRWGKLECFIFHPSLIFLGKNCANIQKVITVILWLGVPYDERDRSILSQPFVDKVSMLKNGYKGGSPESTRRDPTLMVGL
jgi:hypothetical protein